MNGRPPHPILAFTCFELTRRVREPATWLAAAMLFGLLLLGHLEYWNALPPRPDDARMFGYAFIAAAVALVRFGFAEDRAAALDTYFCANLIAPGWYVAAKLLAGAVLVLGLGAASFILALALSGLELHYAAWYATLFTLIAWMLLPAVLLVEQVVETRFAALVVMLGFLITAMALEPFHGAAQVVEWAGLDVRRFEFATLGPLAARAGVATASLLLAAPLLAWRQTSSARDTT